MYVYFNELGVIKEIVQNEHLRQGSSNANELYLYFAGDRTLSQLTLTIQVNDSEETTYTRFIDLQEDRVANVEIPYNPTQQLKYFSYYTPYTMYKYTFVDDDLAYDGVLKITPRAYFDGGSEAQGEILLMVEESVIVNNPQITRAEYENLLNEINKVKNMKAKLYKHSIAFQTTGNISHTGRLDIFTNSSTPFYNVQAILDYCETNNITFLGNANENTGGTSGLVMSFDQVVSVYVATVNDEKVLQCEIRYVVDATSEGAPQGFILHTTTAQINYIYTDNVMEIPLSLE